jgi:hypothetical protein
VKITRPTPVPSTLSRLAIALLVLVAACGGRTLDAGSDTPGLLPVDERNPVILNNDNYDDNWQGVYAVLFSNAGGPSLEGIVINASTYAPDINKSLAAWQGLVTAARSSGMRNIPDPIASQGSPLARPSDGDIDSTPPNRSAGALLIVEASARQALPDRPLVVVTGGRLTDVADAYLVDKTVAERVVVVSSLGSVTSTGGVMGAPNGELDPWADWIVAQKFRYVQVSTFYDQTTDITPSQIASLPQNALGAFIANQQPAVEKSLTRADHVSIIAVGLPKFVVSVERVAQDPTGPFDANIGPKLVPDGNGHVWLVTGVDGALATTRLWQMLQDPKTFGG